MLTVWMRAIRVRFLLASIVAVATGLSVHWWQHGTVDVAAAALTLGGVTALHASVDLLNDYWDYRRGIDTAGVRTPMSGGTGVLPEGLLTPRQVYCAGIGFLALGTAIGGYFVVTDGPVIAAILGFAIVSIYFYSTRIVDSGLGELFIAIKGTMIVLGTSYIQGSELGAAPLLAGAFAGILSSTVLFVTSFPDHDSDKAGGRRTAVVVLGRQKASAVFWAFPFTAYGLLVVCVALGVFPPYTLAALAAIPFCISSGVELRRHHSDAAGLVPAMYGAVWFGRAGVALLALGFLIPSALNWI